MNASLHGQKGGKKSAVTHEPSEGEAFALIVAGRELRWHDGFILEQVEKESGTPPTRIFSYRVFFPIDACDEWVQAPFNDKSLCFRKPHLLDPKAAAAEMCSARAALGEDEEE